MLKLKSTSRANDIRNQKYYAAKHGPLPVQIITSKFIPNSKPTTITTKFSNIRK